MSELITIYNDGRKIPSNANETASFIGGLGQMGLEEARKHWQAEMTDRQRTGATTIEGIAKLPWVIEGILDGKTVYRENGSGGNLPQNINEIPDMRKEEVSYQVKIYDMRG